MTVVETTVASTVVTKKAVAQRAEFQKKVKSENLGYDKKCDKWRRKVKVKWLKKAA